VFLFPLLLFCSRISLNTMASPQTLQNPSAKRFVCNHGSGSCQKQYTSKGSLDRHIKKFHGVDLPKCPWCPFPSDRPHRMWKHMEKKHPKKSKGLLLKVSTSTAISSTDSFRGKILQSPIQVENISETKWTAGQRRKVVSLRLEVKVRHSHNQRCAYY
jgi:hypothetical protein